MRLPPTRELVSRLVLAERVTCRHVERVASRFERANSGVVLFELVCHTRASLDELEALADQRSIPFGGLGPWVRSLVGVIAQWLGDLWPMSTQVVYSAIASATMRDVEIAAHLRLAALRVSDHALADWCAQWMAQRVGLIERLTSSLGIADAHRYARLSRPFQAPR